MKTQQIRTLTVMAVVSFICTFVPATPAQQDAGSRSDAAVLSQVDQKRVESEIESHYSAAHPEVQEYVRMTARTFGRNGMWFGEDAFVALTDEEREKRVVYLSILLTEGEYGRHLCQGIAEAGSLKDERLVPGLMKVAGYHRDDRDYDCRAKWMAVAALARQESDAAVPLLISLLDHGNQNTRMWASAALARKSGRDLGKDKKAWAEWWESTGHGAVSEKYLEPWSPPAGSIAP